MSQTFPRIALFVGRNSLIATGGLVTTLLSLFLPIHARAVPITYSYSGIASGTVGGLELTDAEFLITYRADTDNIPPGASVQVFSENTAIPFAVNPLPTFSWGEISGTFAEPGDGAFHAIGLDSDGNVATLFNGTSSELMFAFTDPAFNGYDLTTPFSFFGVPERNPDSPAYATDAGELRFTNVPGGVAFNAAVTVIPEPSTFALALPALGIIGSAVIKRRKK